MNLMLLNIDNPSLDAVTIIATFAGIGLSEPIGLVINGSQLVPIRGNPELDQD